MSTISFELHVKVAEEIDVETCSYGQLSEVQMLHNLANAAGKSNGAIVCRVRCVPQYRNMAIRIS